MEPAPPIVDRLSKCQTRMEPRQPRLLPETLRSSIASPNAPPSHYVRRRCRTCRTLIRGAIDFRPWNRADSRRLAHHSAALDTAHETVPVLNFSHTILRRESIMILPDYIPNAQVLGHPLHTMLLHTLNLSCLTSGKPICCDRMPIGFSCSARVNCVNASGIAPRVW